MGVDLRVVLPANVRVQDVAKVIGIAAGLEAKYEKFTTGTGGYTEVSGVKIKSTSVPEMAYIVFDDRHAPYFFEGESESADKRMFIPKSTPFWIAVSKRLVEFFGGYVDFNNSDYTDVDISVKEKSNLENRPTRDRDWENFQQRLLSVPRIHKDEMVNAAAAYSDDGYSYKFDNNGLMVR